MMKKILALAVFALFALAPLAAPPAARAEISAQKEITVAPGETQEEIVSFGGHVLIEGKVKGDVVVIGGSITVSGEAPVVDVTAPTLTVAPVATPNSIQRGTASVTLTATCSDASTPGWRWMNAPSTPQNSSEAITKT